MNKHQITIAALLTAALLSCTKEARDFAGPDDTLTVTVEGLNAPDDDATRTTLSTYATHWESGDSIALFDSDGHRAVYEFLTAASGEPGKATFVRKSGGDGFMMSKFDAAFYPAEYAPTYSTTAHTITASLPDTLSYTAVGKLRAPMASNQYNSSTKTLTFANAFGVVDLSVFGTGTVSRIDLSSSTSNLTGNFQFTLSGTNAIAVTPPSGNSQDVTLDCGTPGIAVGTSSSSATSFIIPVPGNVTDGSTFSAILRYDVSTTVKDSACISFTVNTTDQSKLNYLAQNYILKLSHNRMELPHYLDGVADRGEGILINGVIWAPVNCGYDPTDYQYGKLYQWGRKYGQGYGNDSTVEHGDPIYKDATYPTGDQINEYPWPGDNGFEDADSFYASPTHSGTRFEGDWIALGSLDFWDKSGNSQSTGNVTPQKSDYDPCPTGWRVPTYYELNSLFGGDDNSPLEAGTHGSTTGLQGYYFNGTNSASSSSDPVVFLPAAGIWDGGAEGRTYGAMYWTSTVCDRGTNTRSEAPPWADSWLLFFQGLPEDSEEKAAEFKYAVRSLAVSVRCVHE